MNKRNESYWLYGKHSVYAALKNEKRKYNDLLITKNNITEFLSKFSDKKISHKIVDRDEIDRTLGRQNLVHQGIALKVMPLDENMLEVVVSKSSLTATIVIVDQINDPQNLGAIIRSCAAFDVEAIIVPQNHSTIENATVAKAASGALELIPMIKVINIASTIEILKKNGYWIAGLTGDGDASFENLIGINKLALIYGSEGEGLRSLTRKNCDFLLSIDIHQQIESLNLSNAVAISLYQRYKDLKLIQ